MTLRITLSSTQSDQVQMLAAYNNVSVSSIVNRALRDYVARTSNLSEISSWWEELKREGH